MNFPFFSQLPVVHAVALSMALNAFLSLQHYIVVFLTITTCINSTKRKPYAKKCI